MLLKPFALETNNIVKQLRGNIVKGLDRKEAIKRLAYYGKNELLKKGPKKRMRILADQFLDPIIYILTSAALLSFIFTEWLEGIAIVIVIGITVLIGFFMELQAVRSLEALRKMGQAVSLVFREGKVARVKAATLVPGDIILLNSGDIISADARLLTQENLTVKEASLTGESIPVQKSIKVLPDNVPTNEQINMVFKGTSVIRGNAKAIVVATGINTELGKIHQISMDAKEEDTPLEKKLNQLSKWLIWLTLILALLVVITGLIRGIDIYLMIQTGVALAIAAIPEGLPIVATIALARGMIRLSKRKVIIKTLGAVETLGATNIICTDKTGTLTENKMTVDSMLFDTSKIDNIHEKDHEFLSSLKSSLEYDQLLMTSILCNDVYIQAEKKWGDSIDLALIEFAVRAGFDPTSIQRNNPEITKLAFDSESRIMATVNINNDGYTVYSKGAFESVVEHCDTKIKDGQVSSFNDKAKWCNLVEDLASQGLRILAFAYKNTKKKPVLETLLQELSFIGLIAFKDPARDDVKSTIEIYKNAGIRVIMMTGDHPGTAYKIARDVGLLKSNDTPALVFHGRDIPDLDKLNKLALEKLLKVPVFARVTPQQKLDLVKIYQKHNNIVGMIGDGVNDVPALKKADIGITMGIRGTEAAKEAADIILMDDKFTTTELAIHQGRAIFQNIRQFVVYLLSSNMAEIITVGFAALLNLPSPLMPLQILFLNLVTDIFPSLALGFGKGEKDIMELPPRKANEPIMTAKLWQSTIIYGISITVAVLGITFYANYAMDLPPSQINNLGFFTLIFAQLLNVFNLPSAHLSFFKNEVTTNPWIWGALAICVALVFLAYIITPVAHVLSIVYMPLEHLGLIVLFGFGALAIAQILKRFKGVTY
jgi:Ca2+-transporting ATPase